MDSSLAGRMKLQVFTTSTSAASGSRTISCPPRASTPSMTSLSTWFFGQPSVTRWTRRGAVTVVGELHRDPELVLAEQLHHGLQLVLLLPADADLIALDRHLDLQLRVLHELHDLPALVDRDPLLEPDVLLRAARRPGLDLAPFERLQRHLPARELLAQDVGERADLVVVGREEVEAVVVPRDLRPLTAEVEPLRDLAERLLDGVVDLLQVHAADRKSVV